MAISEYERRAREAATWRQQAGRSGIEDMNTASVYSNAAGGRSSRAFYEATRDPVISQPSSDSSDSEDKDNDIRTEDRVREIASNRRTGYPKSEEKGSSVITGHTVGQDNVTGETIINDGQGNNIQGPSDNQPKPMKKATANRDNVEQGSRDLNIQNHNRRVESGGKSKAGGKVEKSGGLTKGKSSTDEMDPCKPGQTSPGDDTENEQDEENSGGLGTADTPDPPPSPTDPLAIDPNRNLETSTSSSDDGGGSGGGSSTTWNDPPSPPPGDNSGYTPPPDNPDNPGNGGDDNSTPPQGCGGSDDDCQWYNVSSSDDPCPTGTSSRGFAELSDGNVMKLCCGDNRPTGDGCPNDPTSAGWECRNGGCKQVPGGGIYATLSECQDNCGSDESDNVDPNPIQRYACISGECTQQNDGPFENIEDCISSGCELPPLDQSGTYTVKAETSGSCLNEPNSCSRKANDNFFFGLYECGEKCPEDSNFNCTPGTVAGSSKSVSKEINGPIDKFRVDMDAEEDETFGNPTGDILCRAKLVAVFPDGSTTGIITECGSFSISDYGDKQTAIQHCLDKSLGIGWFSISVDPPA
jgi:hypothetical protein